MSLSKIINFRMGLIGAVVMFTIVFAINSDHGWGPALVAGLKQAAYTLLIGGFIIRLCEIIVVKFDSEVKSLILASIIPSLLAITIVFIVHEMKGTPRPIASTIPTVVLSFPGFFYLGLRKRKSMVDRSESSN